MNDPKGFMRLLFDAAVSAASDFAGFASELRPEPGRIVVMAIGKAAPVMVRGLLADPPAWLDVARIEGFVVQPQYDTPFDAPPGWVVLRGDHPVPSLASERAGRHLLSIAASLKAGDLLIALISGGGSSMVVVPRPGLTLHDKIVTARWLLASGRSISEMNAVRGALSAIKGGGLARAAAPARVVTFVLSDVPGDAPWCVASGPTVTPRGPFPALSSADLKGLPAAVQSLLAEFDTPHPNPDANEVVVIGSGDTALATAETMARVGGLTVVNLGSAIQGESRAVALDHARLALTLAERDQATLILSGGETTVRLNGSGGRGGRSSEYALALALALDGHPTIHALAADTDGIDGTGPAAGAFVGPDTLWRLGRLGLNAVTALNAHDSYPVFEALGDSIVTGPTGTNVNEFRAVLILPGRAQSLTELVPPAGDANVTSVLRDPSVTG